MPRHDPVRELEMSERSWQAMNREACQPQNELHRRFIQARTRARHRNTDTLLRRISAVLPAT